MTGPAPDFSAALSDEELETLAAFLADHSTLNFEGLLGLLHAVAIAPGSMPPSSWLHAVLPQEVDLELEDLNEVLALLMRQYNEVLEALRVHSVMLPSRADVAGCKSFADGFVAGAERDPAWRSQADRWFFAAPFAYLAGRHDLLTPTLLAALSAGPDPESPLREAMAEFIWEADEAFTKIRRGAAQAASPAAPRIGRNDPCPCGSGRKYKRCCIDGARAS